MSRFYARYVPPTNDNAEEVASPSPTTEKRKREPQSGGPEKSSKRLRISDSSHRVSDPQTTSSINPKTLTTDDVPPTADNGILDKYRVTNAARSGNQEVEIKPRRKKPPKTQAEGIESIEGNGEPGANTPVENAHDTRHAAVLSKFEKATVRELGALDRSESQTVQPAPELHGLVPIPQPEQIETVPDKPTFSILPSWQEYPLQVPLEANTTFESLGVSGAVLANLRKQGLERAFPVQVALLPLLLDGPSRHPGDLCVSAATGSGKTLAYVLPAIASLQNLVGTKLRAVIVVPTRELVNQVRELCEICAAGTSLKFATAVGSKSLKDEQEMLIIEEKIYDPEQYDKWRRSPVDWSSFSLDALMKNATSEDPMASFGYITRYRSKVDILITTPGRLVDHLKSTPGFTLNDVSWLVVDEADRLLNESYQEWIEVVKPALESQAATTERDELLQYMRMVPPKRKVTKILLSATMTRDLSKLNALGLVSPKLIVLGTDSMKGAMHRSADEVEGQTITRDMQEGSDAFHLPHSLTETAIPIGDGSKKPLYLWELLKNHIWKRELPSEDKRTTSREDSDSSSEATSDSSSSSSEDLSSSEDDSSDSEDSFESDQVSSRRADFLGAPPTGHKSKHIPRALIFARSTASATRLSRLLILLDPSLEPHISTLTRSTASSASSRRALASFRKSKISILIATDRASRGLDVPGLEHVISYDVPSSASTYVHRVGRTARAGMTGQAWTFVEHREGAWFWREIGGKGKKSSSGVDSSEFTIHRDAKINRISLALEGREMKQKYEEALRQLGEEVRGK